jgi:thymidine phosphorylase
LDDGSGFEKFSEMVRKHGGDLSVPRRRGAKREVNADESGIVVSINVERIGIAIIEMGGGRRQLNDAIDHSVGIEILIRIGQPIAIGEPVAYVYCDASDVAELASQLILASIEVGAEPVAAPRLLWEEIK